MAKSNIEEKRAVAADMATDAGEFKTGYVYSFYTATRAFRGNLVAVLPDVFLVHKPIIVWTADNEDVNHKSSKYFSKGKVKGVLEEPGGDWAFIPIGGCVYTICHEVFIGPVECKCVDPNGWPTKGSTVHVCTVTHEFHGKLNSVGAYTLNLTSVSMVNNIENNQFENVLREKQEGSDHFKVCDVQVFLHGMTGVIVAEK